MEYERVRLEAESRKRLQAYRFAEFAFNILLKSSRGLLNLRPSSRSSLAASLSSREMSNMDFYSLESRQ